ncbi:MAG: hybrid sensor histidine kinase/response regulator [Rhodospirillales bacterium]|nr:hybrid sensor histidine kinase/response regulator [Rhodospirillales bacterium]
MTLKLLIVDDNPADRAIVRRMLSASDLDAEYHEVSCVSEFLALPLPEFDCALIDVRMPDKDGIEGLTEACRGTSYPPCPVIVMSGQGDEHTAARAFKAGANDYLIKDTLTPNGLRRTLINAIDKWHAEDAMRNDWETQQQALRNAERASVAKTRFISSLSHQLRVPLTAIMGFAELIESKGLGNDKDAWEKYTEYAADIGQSARDVLTLVSSVMELTRIEIEDGPMMATSFDPKVTLWEVIDTFSDEVIKARLDLKVDDQKAPKTIFTDGRAVQAIMTNLLSRAIKATPAGRYVRVQLSKVDEERCLFSVSDTGIGMNPEDLSRLIRPFERHRAQAISDETGIGIGLPLVNSLVRVLGGELNFDTAPGVGTTATVVLPNHTRERQAPQKI